MTLILKMVIDTKGGLLYIINTRHLFWNMKI